MHGVYVYQGLRVIKHKYNLKLCNVRRDECFQEKKKRIRGTSNARERETVYCIK